MMPIREDEQTLRRWVWLLPLVALLLSATCVTSSTFLALSLWPTEISQAQMLAGSQASYERDTAPVPFAPLDSQIIFAATRDGLGLELTPSPGAANPLVAEIPGQLLPTAKATADSLPTAVIIIATLTPLPTSQPTSEPDRPTPRPTITPQPTETTAPATAVAATVTPPPTIPAGTNTPTVMATATATVTAVSATAIFTSTPSPMPTPGPTQPTTAPPPVPTSTPPAVPPTATPSATAGATFTPLPTNTPTSMPTFMPTPTHTPTPSLTPTSTPTNTPVVPPCTGYVPGGEPNIGLPNGTLAQIGCGESTVVDLGKVIVVAGGAEPAFDLVLYEHENPASTINLDWIIVEVGTSASGPWHQVFYWGNDMVDTNSNIGQLGYGLGGEPDNQPIPFSDLYGGNSAGVAIDLDAVVPAGSYQWVRLSAPLGGANDAAEADSVDALP